MQRERDTEKDAKRKRTERRKVKEIQTKIQRERGGRGVSEIQRGRGTDIERHTQRDTGRGTQREKEKEKLKK